MIQAHDAPGWLRFLGANVYGCLLRNRRFNKTFRQYQRFLKDSQYWDRQQMLDYQLERLSELLTDVSRNVPFYGKHFAASGFVPAQFANLSDLKKIEPVSKSQLRKAGTLCLHRHFKRYNPLFCQSSGTTGEKFAYYVPRQVRFALKSATIWRQYAWAGVKLNDRRVTLGGRKFASRPPYWLHNMSEHQLLLSIHHLNETTAGLYLERIKRFKPVFIQGHPSGVDYLAGYMNDREITVPVKAVFTTGETMPPDQRGHIEKAFECKVFEEYGQGECVFSAQESESHNGFHEVSELGLIEFDATPDSPYKQVIGTSLWNRAMPFIRYRIEDLVETVEAPPPETYRSGLPIKIKRVIGRTDENLTNTSGHIVLPVSVRMTVKPMLMRSQTYQVAQTGPKRYALRMTGRTDGDATAGIKKALIFLLGEDATIETASVENLKSSGGKIRNVVNEMH